MDQETRLRMVEASSPPLSVSLRMRCIWQEFAWPWWEFALRARGVSVGPASDTSTFSMSWRRVNGAQVAGLVVFRRQVVLGQGPQTPTSTLLYLQPSISQTLTLNEASPLRPLPPPPVGLQGNASGMALRP